MMLSALVALKMPPPQPHWHSPSAVKGTYFLICSAIVPMPISLPRSPMAMFGTPLARRVSHKTSLRACRAVTSRPTALWQTPTAFAPQASTETTAAGLRAASSVAWAGAAAMSFVKATTPMLNGKACTVSKSS